MKVILSNEELITKYGGKGPFTVYAIAFGAEVKLAIQSERFPWAPSFVRLEDTTVMDRRFSRYWVIRKPSLANSEPVAKLSMISFPQWADDPMFYSKVVNSDAEAGACWREYRNLLDNEFTNQ